ncbi:MAG: hypothetical protein RL268_184 [Pseudomonadota bacterium]|jgi:hypothetical protein
MSNAHDRRTLEDRLQWIADWSEPDIDLADAGKPARRWPAWRGEPPHDSRRAP